MKRTYFIKHDQRIRRILGCDRATLIFDRLEFYSSRQPNGFYKFLEPNSHKLYRQDDSWTEILDCHRTSFWRAFKLIGKKHTSRWEFEKSEDRFEGKLYASYYDRNTNRMFFVRNHDAVKEFFTMIQHGSELGVKTEISEVNSQPCPGYGHTKNSLRTEQNARSYKESKLTSLDLSKDKSHASDEIIKKMIDIWTAIIGEGKSPIELKGKIIPFLKKALTDQFNSCLQKWKEYCTKIARSKFLMGEKTSWKATLEWALKFDVIAKILSGEYYGIGDRIPKAILPSEAALQGEILSSEETGEIKDFRVLCLETAGNAKYISYFKNLDIEFREGGEIALISPHKFAADDLERNCYSYLRQILQGLGERLNAITILAPGETVGRLVVRERGGGNTPAISPVSKAEHCLSEELSVEESVSQDEPLLVISSKTQALREKLKKEIPPQQFPSWLDKIEVEKIEKDGTVIVTLEDSLAVQWCQTRFSNEVFKSARGIWSCVTRLVIQQKERSSGISSIENYLRKPENTDERSTFEQAIQSLLSACSPKTMGMVGMQEDCPGSV